ncbi:hypothetical protein C8Q80DRAFT_507598 [Daedaleopsis nitida]|nr:hypothetical protein C8Q80DRAFT_507598 [Daedaleopsis nitida]
MAGLPCNDRALLAQGASGSSVVITLDDVVSLWLTEAEDLGIDAKPPRTSGTDTTASPVRSSTSHASVKLEPTPVSIPPVSSSSFTLGSHIPSGGMSLLHPPAPYDAFLPPPSAGPSALPQVTAALIAYLPSEPSRSRCMKAFRETMLLHPSLNIQHFEQRLVAMYTWAESGEAPNPTPAYGAKPMSKQDLARDIFCSKPGSSNGTGSARSSINAPKPTLSFFSAACAAFALGALVARDDDPDSGDPTAPSPSPSIAIGDTVGTPAMLFALSEQSLQLSEKTTPYDLDAVIAMIMQVLFMLHEGRMSVAQGVFPLVGKMVNVARMMGLAIDPDEFPGTYNLFEAETRRRVWWEVFYFDLFVADAMGHPPLIADNSHTTRLPADVDEDKFTPSCTSLPEPEGTDGDSSSVYFSLKCRLAQLVKSVKKQTFRDPLSEDPVSELNIDQAGAFESDVGAFLQELPAGFKLEMTHDISKPLPTPSGSPIRLAQKCELAILANRLIIKLYLPFLKEAAATSRPAHQAVFGTVNAAHQIVYAARVLHAVWGQTRPAMFDFYDFGRTLFDAAVVCAHTVIQDPSNVVANECLKSVACALDILKELGSGASRLGVEGSRTDKYVRSEAVRIVELMKRKAEAARGAGPVVGTKRKHAELEGELLAASSGASFQFPFVGAAVSSIKADQRPRGSRAAGAKEQGKPEAKKHAKEKDREKDKDGQKEKGSAGKYFNGPLRVRPMTGQPAPRKRTASVSTTAGATPGPGPVSTPAPALTPAPASTSAPPASGSMAAPPAPSPLTTTPPNGLPAPPPSRASLSVPQSPLASTPYEAYVPSRSTAPPEQPQPQPQAQDEFGMQYSSSPDDSIGGGSSSDDRRFSYDSAMYDPQAQAQQSQYGSPVAAYPPPGPTAAAPQQNASQTGYYVSYAPAAGYEGMGMMDASGAVGLNGYARQPEYGRHQQQHPQAQAQAHAQHPQHQQHQHQSQHQHQHGQHPQHSQQPPHAHAHSHPQHAQHPPHPPHSQHPPHPPHPQHPQHSHSQPPMAMAGWAPEGDPGISDMWQDYNKFYGA